MELAGREGLKPHRHRTDTLRAGAADKKAKSCGKESEQFLAAAKAVQLLPGPATADAFRIAAEEFQKQLSPWVLRRRKAVAGNDSVLERFIRDHGPDYRDRSQRITAEVAGKEWSVAMMAVEALSLMPATGLAPQKRLRLALARGFSLASAFNAAEKPEKGDWRDSDEQTLSAPGRDPVINQQEKRRRERAGFWLDRLKPAAANPYAHPALLAAVRAIEEITTHAEAPEKVLVFGIFTQAMRRLTDLLNAREMIRRLMVFSCNPDAPFKTWHWPGETIPVDAHFREALAAALQMADMRNLVGNHDIATLSGLMQRQYDKYRSQRARALDEVRSYVTETLGPQIGLAAQDEKLVLQLTQALIEIMDDQQSRQGRSDPAEAWEEFQKENLPRYEEDEDGTADSVKDLSSEIRLALSDFDGRSGFFARRLAGGMGPAAKQHLQTAFNRRASWPMVLVAQSSVGREGLNLHKSCRTVVLFQPEWNPGVVEQQIGRVDRIGSLWEEMVSQHRGNTEPPKIRILPVELPGSYDEHNWEVLNERWDSYRAQMNGEVFASAKSRSQPSSEVVAVVRNATPDFSPLPGAPET
ncbi:C-terminal helicase domain-containing protein [Paracoccus aminophilus]|uniref:ATP-dependent RNA helicase n=1 Tax=Paracoccus aminophilus JCM 7686 TaxID=1367847 RepID=S5Z287_PARAH|nr:C-terminal helicase domain-containing protein [Paracoccus aminophilus]AGT11511.1 ATP-dependent RNA helicase [Paracoccus aminophilus JCM 7686]